MNDFTPGIRTETFKVDHLIGGDFPRETGSGVLAQGQKLLRGALLGIINGTAIAITAKAGNVGNGNVVGLVLGQQPQPGVYTLVADADVGGFTVTDPQGNALTELIIGQPYDTPAFGMTLTQGATPFAVGDTFTVTIAAGSGEYTLSTPTATDGSQIPTAILLADTDASAGPVPCPVYFSGEFDENAITYGTGWNADAVRAALRGVGIFLKRSVTANPPLADEEV